MPQKKPLVVVTRKLPEVVEARMRELFDVRLNETDAPMSNAQLAEAMRTADVLVPMASGWKPLAVAWGIVSMYLLVAVEATSLLRRHLTKKQWRAVHLLSFPLFLSATAHGVSAGTELGTLGGTIAAVLVTATVAGLTTYRILDARERAAHAGRIPVDVVRMAP